MIDWEKNYHRVFDKYTASDLRNTQLLDEEIDFLDGWIKNLQRKRAKLMAIKHHQAKERFEQMEKVKADLRKKGVKLPGE